MNAPLKQTVAGEPVKNRAGVATSYPQACAQSLDCRVLGAARPTFEGAQSLAQDMGVDAHGVDFQCFLNWAAKSEQAALGDSRLGDVLPASLAGPEDIQGRLRGLMLIDIGGEPIALLLFAGIVFEPIFVLRPFESVHPAAQAVAEVVEELHALQHDVDLARSLIVALNAL
jgi:hypothetical protein